MPMFVLLAFFKVFSNSKSALILVFFLAVGVLLFILGFRIHAWHQLGRYYQDHLRLRALPSVEGRVVFLGDSITDWWNLAKYFPGKPYVNRGIGGQTTVQMLARMHRDVIRIHPAAFILLAGTNDIAGIPGPEALETVKDNVRAMCELAASHNIKIILCLLTPVSDYGKRKQTEQRSPADIVRLNHWIESYARDIHAEVADYYAALVDDKGMLREGFSEDGLHPNARGYELLAPVAEAAIERALKKGNPTSDPGLRTIDHPYDPH
jgi:lysophospholipase L1-like esterase